MEAEKSGGCDFLEWLGPDTSASIFSLLDDPADLARAAAVSHSWRRFVAANAFCKSLCLRICPEVATFVHAIEVSGSPPAPAAAHTSGSSHDAESDHRIYSYLGGSLVSSKPSVGCVLHCIGASSTDRFPAESMENTLDPREMVGHRPSYWSSGGQYDPDVPESLSYWLQPRLFLVDEIKIRPYQVSFYDDRPICSSKTVRFQIGRSKLSYSSAEVNNQSVIDNENYVWTYTSPEFPMAQENVLKSFKLPRPVLCIDGVVRIELLGRTQKAFDDMCYICICHVQVIGRSLLPVFMVDISDSGYTIVKCLPGARK